MASSDRNRQVGEPPTDSVTEFVASLPVQLDFIDDLTTWDFSAVGRFVEARLGAVQAPPDSDVDVMVHALSVGVSQIVSTLWGDWEHRAHSEPGSEEYRRYNRRIGQNWLLLIFIVGGWRHVPGFDHLRWRSVPSRTSEVDRFYPAQREALVGEPSIATKQMLGTSALCVDGKVFTFPWLDRLVVKLPASLAAELVAAGHAELFDPGHGGTHPMWVAVFASASDRWTELTQQARAFVAGEAVSGG